MSDRPATTPPPDDASGLPDRLLVKLKVEVEGYELIERLGEGGQATVYKAIDRNDGKTVAIKILHAGPHASDEARARLDREGAALRALNHPNIVQAIASVRTRTGLDCLVMGFIEGRPLDALWEDREFAARLTPDPSAESAARLRLFRQICETLQAAHRSGITHRDLSPSNILIDNEGRPHILDFGMASTAFDSLTGRAVTVTGQFIGKLKYASPEQARTAGGDQPKSAVDIRSDVYALGVILYQLLTDGAFPYEVVGNIVDVLNNIIHSKPKRPSEVNGGAGLPAGAPSDSAHSKPLRRNPPLVNETIEAVVLKALEKDPEKRYQSAGELGADIDNYLSGRPTLAELWSARNAASVKRAIPRRAQLAALGVTIPAFIGVSMYARPLAAWLGLTAGAAAHAQCDVAWQSVASAATKDRYGHGMAFDSIRGVMVTFGGIPNHGTAEYNGISWVTRYPLNSPPKMNGHAMAFDSIRARTVLLGSATNTTSSAATWEWDGNDWIERGLPGPSPRVAHEVVFDSRRGVCVLYGGLGDNETSVLSDTWEYDGRSWKQIDITGPGPRHNYAMSYDSDRGRVVLFSGASIAGGPLLGDTWEYDGSSWIRVADGAAVDVPTPRMVYDARARRLIRYDGGQTPGSPSETFQFLAGAWLPAARAEPPRRYNYTLEYDTTRQVTVLFAGHDELGLRGDTWEYAGPSGPPISDQPDHAVRMLDEPVSFSVTTPAQPATFQWYRDGQALLDGGRFSGVKTATLSISAVEPGDVGSYAVIVSSNGCGTGSDAAKLEVFPRRPP